MPPGQVVAIAAEAGVELLALSDHDTVEGVDEAIDAGRSSGVRVVPAVEISAIDDEGATPRELHILGYLVKHRSPRFAATLKRFLADREQRTLRMADALRSLGFALDEGPIEERISKGEPIGRPHLAEAVLRSPANATRLEREGIDEVGSMIKAYLIEGKEAFAMRKTPTVQESIAAIHDAGGLAVWAHPFWDVAEAAESLAMVDRFAALGIDGIEAFYITHSEEQTRLLFERCERLSLLSTGSADFHGPENRLFCKFLAFDTFGLTPRLGPIAG